MTLPSWLTSLSWLPATIPVLAAALVKVVTAVGNNRQEHQLERQLARHAELLGKLPDNADKAGLVGLVNREIAALAAHTEARLYRRVDGANVAAMVVVMVITTVLVWFFWWLDPSQRWLNRVLNIAAVVVGFLGFALATIGGFGNLYKDIRPDPQKTIPQRPDVETSTIEAEDNGSRRATGATTPVP